MAMSLLAALCCLLAGPAQAMPDPCQSLSSSLRAADLAWLTYDLRNRFPRNDAEVLKPISVAEVDRPDLLGPVYDRKGDRIVIPRQFLRTQCHMVLLQVVFQAEPNHDFEAVRVATRDCMEAASPKLTCLDGAISRFIAGLTLTRPPPALENNAVDLLALTVFAVRFQLAHEAGHILTNARTASVEAYNALDVELEADILAEVSMIGDVALIEAPLYAMATASLADPDGDDQHEPTICRFEETRSVIRDLGARGLLLNSWDQSSRTVRTGPATASLRAIKSAYFTAPPRQDCAQRDDQRLAAVKADLDDLIKLLNLQRASDQGFVVRDLGVADTKLAAFTPRTPAGARLRALLRMTIVMMRYDFSQALTISADGKAGEDFEAYLASLRTFGDLTGPDAGAHFRSGELAALLFSKALTTFARQPKNSSLRENTRLFRDDLRRIDQISPLNDTIQADLFVIGISPANQAPGISRLVLSRLQFEASMNLILGDCREANRLLQTARAAVGAGPSKPISDAACREEGKSSGRKIAEDLGWKVDLP
ncbi:hypothetical protein [Caulobacter sp.]|uniref:hypothetical protein n=1 Tax=Caulobacter sp. TaxID=78 RepID=UPI0031DEE9F3